MFNLTWKKIDRRQPLIACKLESMDRMENDYYELAYDFFFHEYALKAAESEYHKYVCIGAWSDKICHRVDQLKEIIETSKREIERIDRMMKENY